MEIKLLAFLPVFALLLISAAIAQDATSASSISSLLSTPPPGVNTAAYPEPRQEWVEHVQINIDHARKQQQTAPIQLIFDGDSITDRWQNVGTKTWQERYGKLGAFDFGISADRTQHLLWRLDHGQVDGLQPRLIALMIGTNNLGSNSVQEIADAVTAIVKEYQARCPKAVILLQAIFPRGKDPADPTRAKIKAVNEIIAKLQDGKRVIYIDIGDKFLQPDGTISADIMPDYVHPSAKGYEIWADAIQPVIDTYFPPAGK
jgi:lysophospholipase L1-like esterase